MGKSKKGKFSFGRKSKKEKDKLDSNTKVSESVAEVSPIIVRSMKATKTEDNNGDRHKTDTKNNSDWVEDALATAKSVASQDFHAADRSELRIREESDRKQPGKEDEFNYIARDATFIESTVEEVPTSDARGRSGNTLSNKKSSRKLPSFSRKSKRSNTKDESQIKDEATAMEIDTRVARNSAHPSNETALEDNNPFEAAQRAVPTPSKSSGIELSAENEGSNNPFESDFEQAQPLVGAGENFVERHTHLTSHDSSEGRDYHGDEDEVDGSHKKMKKKRSKIWRASLKISKKRKKSEREVSESSHQERHKIIVQNAQREVEETKAITVKNVGNLIERGENLSDLRTKAEELEMKAEVFKVKTRQVRDKNSRWYQCAFCLAWRRQRQNEKLKKKQDRRKQKNKDVQEESAL